MEPSTMKGRKKNVAKLSSLVRKMKVLKYQNSVYAQELKDARSEIESLTQNNVELARALAKATREQHNATILQKNFDLDSAYKNLTVKYVNVKKQIEKFKLAVRSIDDELTNVGIPGLVAFSDCIKAIKFEVNECVADDVNSQGNAMLPRHSEPILKDRINSYQQQSSKVNPMVQGHIIQHPTITIPLLSANVTDDNSTSNYMLDESARFSRDNRLSIVPEETSAEMRAETVTPPIPVPIRRGGLRHTLNVLNKNRSAKTNKDSSLNKSPQLVPTLNISDDSNDEEETAAGDTYNSPSILNVPEYKGKLTEGNMLEYEKSARYSPVVNYDPLEGPSSRYMYISSERTNENVRRESNATEEDYTVCVSKRESNIGNRRTLKRNKNECNGETGEIKTESENDGRTVSSEEEKEFPGFENEDVSLSNEEMTDFFEKTIIFPNVASRRKNPARHPSISTLLGSSRSSSRNDESTLGEVTEMKSAGDSYISFKMTSRVKCSSPLDQNEISNNSSVDHFDSVKKRGRKKGSKNKPRSLSLSINPNLVSSRRKRRNSSSNETTNSSNNTNRVDSEGFSNEYPNTDSRRPKRAASHKVTSYQEPSLTKKLRR